MPHFILPKKDGEIRLMQDCRKLNSYILCQQYVLPLIQDLFLRRRNYKFLTKIDLRMQYYSFVLDDESSWLWVFITIFRKCHCLRLPMGLSQSPDWAQATMEQVFWDMLHELECYLDDMSIFDLLWGTHIPKLDKVLGRLHSNSFSVNPLKCEWGVQETDFLGYWMTSTGLKP